MLYMENKNLTWAAIEYDNTHHDSNNRGAFVSGAEWAIERVKEWLKDFCYEVNVMNIRYGADVTETKVYTEFDTMQDMFDNLHEEIMES